MKIKKDKLYSIRQNKQLVDKVKKEKDLSPQQILDKAYSEFMYLWDLKDEPIGKPRKQRVQTSRKKETVPRKPRRKSNKIPDMDAEDL